MSDPFPMLAPPPGPGVHLCQTCPPPLVHVSPTPIYKVCMSDLSTHVPLSAGSIPPAFQPLILTLTLTCCLDSALSYISQNFHWTI